MTSVSSMPSLERREGASPMYINRWWNITHACNERQNSRVFLVFTKPNQTDIERHPCTVHKQVVEYHTCLQRKAKFAGFYVFTKPNQTERAHHTCTSAGDGISHMPAMNSKIRGFFLVFTQPNQTDRANHPCTYINRWWNITHACNGSKIRGFSSFYQTNRQGASPMYINYTLFRILHSAQGCPLWF